MHQLQEERPPSVSSAISNAVVQITREYTGRGPRKAKTVINHDVITVLLQDMLTKGERTLAEAGEAEAVLQMRQRFQQAMREDLVSAVEVLTEREVIAFMSDNHIDPDMWVEVFALAPEETGPVDASPSS
jgi:uncharacterized protein YbcI